MNKKTRGHNEVKALGLKDRFIHRTHAITGVSLVALLLVVSSVTAQLETNPIKWDRDHATDLEKKAMESFALKRKGYLVWESRRPSGSEVLKYRIWKRNLDGGELQMISADPGNGDYSHIGPRVSPDGRHVVFGAIAWNGKQDSRLPTLWGGSYAAGPFDLWVVDINPVTLKPGKPRELKELHNRCGTSFQDHFFEWKDNATIYVSIPAQKGIFEVDINSGKIGRQVVKDLNQNGILSPTGTYLLSGGQYAKFIPSKDGPGKPGPFITLPIGGCQIRIGGTDDWVLWVHHGATHHIREISRFNLKTGKTKVLHELYKSLPNSHNFQYFPSLSRDKTILALAGGTVHSHIWGDYEIFLFLLDPEKL